MAGSDSRFDPAFFRTQIRNTMTMGLPENEADRPTFRWTTKQTFNISDPRDRPYDYSEPAATTTTHPDVQVPVAFEMTGGMVRTEFTPAGEYNDKVRYVLTVLDTDYPSIEGADQVIMGGAVYHIDYVAPPMGLFPVEIYQIYVTAQDES